jgi:tRNA (guanine-N7-)-methyltransferase
MNSTSHFHRKIRSFMPRQGRMTMSQQIAIEQNWSIYGLTIDQAGYFAQLFPNSAPIIMEIGFGNGQSLAAMAAANPHYNYLGIEVHKPGVGQLMNRLNQLQLTNVKIFQQDAVEILQQIPDNSLSGIQLFFPDPWPKRCHHKRRLVNAEFVQLIHRKLKTGGYFHAATDWLPYAEQILSVLSANQGFKNTSINQMYCPRPDYRPLTKFEQRGLKLGHGVWDLIFISDLSK